MTEKKKNEDLYNSFSRSFDEIVNMIKAIEHPNRLKILIGLLKDPKTFQELKSITNLEKSALSSHLIKLLELNLVEKYQHGNYRITDDGLELLGAIESAYQKSEIRKKNELEVKQRKKAINSFLESKIEKDKKEADQRKSMIGPFLERD